MTTIDSAKLVLLIKATEADDKAAALERFRSWQRTILLLGESNELQFEI